jgi:L-iditol 2-dehydrogenase
MVFMKTAQFTSPFQIRLTEVPTKQPAEDEVLVKIKYAGICGTDFKIFDGTIPYIKQGKLSYPMVPGHEWSGEIVKIGSRVNRLKIGDRVTGECHIGCGKCEDCSNGRSNICFTRERLGIIGRDGAFSQYLVIPEKAVHVLTPNVTDIEGALVEPLTIALHAIDKLNSVAGANVLVFGLGPIGLLVSQVVKAMGAATIIGVDLDENRRILGKRLGCNLVTDASDQALAQMIEQQTSGHGVDIIIEATGVKSLLSSAVDLVRPGGQISLVGLYDGKVEVDATQLITKDIRLYGNMASARVWDRAIRLLESKKIDVNQLITHVFQFDNFQDAMNTAYRKHEGSIKVMIKM